MEAPYIVALVIAAVACITDLRTGRIPNVLTFSSAVAALFFHAVVGRGEGILLSLTGLIVGVVVFFIPFALRGLGAGDVKLLGAIGAWIGPAAIAWTALYTGILGGVLCVVVAAFHGYLRQAISNIRALLVHWWVGGLAPLPEVTLGENRGPRLAYAVPILMGLIVTVAWRYASTEPEAAWFLHP
jgi:prepilin peptidase CpaA